MVDLFLEPDTQLITVEDNSPTISVLWNQTLSQAIINTNPGPTIASRAYSMMHSAIFDAWATYDPVAIATTYGDDWQRPAVENTLVNKRKAMSYAAYGAATELFPQEVILFDSLMRDLGYDADLASFDLTTPEGIGSLAADSLLRSRVNDGSNQLGNSISGDESIPYADVSGYQYINKDASQIVDLELWTPEDVFLGGEPQLQEFLTPHWGNVTSFAPESSQVIPPAPEPFLLVGGDVDLSTKTITLDDGSVVEIDRDLIGTIINPDFIAQTEQVIEYSANLTDEQKLIAEFWEDGKGTPNPPGTWMTLGEFVSARDDHSLDSDAKLFFTLGNAVFDAGIATWKAKAQYNYARPVRTIHTLGELGLIGKWNKSLDGYAIEAWQPNQGTETILATDFITYQTPNSDPSPPFAEYTSGHSAFSAAAAEVLQLSTNSDRLGASVSFEVGSSRFEPDLTPTDTITLEWNTFSEAADEAGISRLYGGIHFEQGDLNGRLLGREVGSMVYNQAQFFINGGEKGLSTFLRCNRNGEQ